MKTIMQKNLATAFQRWPGDQPLPGAASQEEDHVSASTWRRWIKKGLVKDCGGRYALTIDGYQAL